MSPVALKTVVAGGVVYPAGTAVPDEVAEGITSPGVLDEYVAQIDPAAPYELFTVADLKAAIAERNESRDGEPLAADGKKADLIAVLVADDASGQA